MSPSMRLVAVTLALWESSWDRIAFTPAELADRTGLTVEQLSSVMDKLEQVRMVRARADGWELTFDEFRRTTFRAWNDRGRVRAAL